MRRIHFVLLICLVSMELIGLPLEISVDKLEGIKDKELAPLEEVDGKKVRVIKAGSSLFTIPAWWGTDARPKEDEIFILEIDFKDELSKPAIVSSFGNCANSFGGLSELHRIGGLNDKTWKRGTVPVSWDYLYAGEGAPAGLGKQVFGIEINKEETGNLLISEFRIRNATLEDERRYNAETREWIKKVQKRHSPELISDSELTKPHLPDNWRLKECIPYLRSYLNPVFTI